MSGPTPRNINQLTEATEANDIDLLILRQYDGIGEWQDKKLSIEDLKSSFTPGTVTIQTADDNEITGAFFRVIGMAAYSGQVMDTNTESGETRIENRSWITPYIVDPDSTVGQRGTFTTIQAAINAAVADGLSTLNNFGVIDLRMKTFGTYSENINIPSNRRIMIRGPVRCMVRGSQPVFITGVATVSSGATLLLQDVGFFNNADPCFVNSGNIFLNNSFVQGASGSGFISANNSTLQNLIITGGFFEAFNCDLQSSGASTITDTQFVIRKCFGAGAQWGVTLNGTSNGSITNADRMVLDGNTTGAVRISNSSIFSPIDLPNATVTYNQIDLDPQAIASEFFTTFPLNRRQATQGNVLKRRESSGVDVMGWSDQLIYFDTDFTCSIGVLTTQMFPGQEFILFDSVGHADIRPITVTPDSGTINGQPNIMINQPFGWAILYWDGTNFTALMSLPSQISFTTGDGETVTGTNFNLLPQYAGDVPVMDTYQNVGDDMLIENRTWQTQYIVDANTTVGLRGTFTTIQAAINQAVTDGESTSSRIATIWIRPGTYAENLVMPGSGICLKALVPNGAYTNQTQEVIISGNMTFSALAISIFENLSIAPSITITGTETKVNFINCLLSVTNISGGSPNFYNCNWINSVLTSGGTPNFYECNLTANISISAGTATFQDCNVSPITLSSTGTAICFSCYFPNGGSALSGSSSSTQQLYNCGFSSDQAIACTANVQYSGLWSTAVSSRNFFTTAPTPLLDNCTQGNILQFRKTAVSDTVLKTDYYIGVTNTAAARTITLPTTGITALEPSRGQVFIIKDESNAASINNITITPNGGTIDGAASKVIAVNGGSYQIFFDGTNYFTLPQLGNSFVPKTSWTPVLNFGGATTGITYSSQIGEYSRIGNMVTIYCEIVLSSKGSATGSATITGFPLTSSQTFPFAFRVQNLSFTSIPMFRITGSTISAEQVASAGALSDLTDASFTNTSLIQLTATILV